MQTDHGVHGNAQAITRLKVCVPCLVLFETRLKDTSRIGETVTGLVMSGPVAREFSGKIPDLL